MGNARDRTVARQQRKSWVDGAIPLLSHCAACENVSLDLSPHVPSPRKVTDPSWSDHVTLFPHLQNIVTKPDATEMNLKAEVPRNGDHAVLSRCLDTHTE